MYAPIFTITTATIRRVATEQRAIATDSVRGRALRRLAGLESAMSIMGIPSGTVLDRFTCPMCLRDMVSLADRNWNSDHAVPEANGGPSTQTNLVAVCALCNRAKGDLTLPRWVDEVAGHAIMNPARGDDALAWVREHAPGRSGRQGDWSPAEVAVRRDLLVSLWG